MDKNQAMQEPKDEEIILWQDHVNDPGYRWKLTMIKWPDGTHSIRAYLGGQVYTKQFVYPECKVCDTNFKPMKSYSSDKPNKEKTGLSLDEQIKQAAKKLCEDPLEQRVERLEKKVELIAGMTTPDRLSFGLINVTDEWKAITKGEK